MSSTKGIKKNEKTSKTKKTCFILSYLLYKIAFNKIYNNQIKRIEDDKFVPHFSTWLSQRRWEVEDSQEIPDLINRLKNLGYVYKGSEGQFELFTKADKNYKIDKFDEKHQIQLIQ